jgi:hypothetical protein
MQLVYGRHGRWALVGLLAASCADDGEVTGDGGGSSTSGGASESSTGSSTTMVADASTAGSQGESSGMGESSSTGEPVTEVRLSGTIQDFFAMLPIADAQISVLGLPGFDTVSDARGLWEVPGLPLNTFDRFVVADTADYWGAVVPFQTAEEDVDEIELSQVSLDVIDLQIGALQQQDPTVMVEDGTAVFLVALLQNTATGAVVTVDPPPDPTTFYAPDANGQPILGVNEITWSVYPVAVFFNLAPGAEGDYEITVTHPERECTVEDPQPPTFARHINLIRVDCPPPA